MQKVSAKAHTEVGSGLNMPHLLVFEKDYWVIQESNFSVSRRHMTIVPEA